jgi:hypothetical protein
MYVSPEVIVIPSIFVTLATVLITRMSFRHREKMAELEKPRGAADPELQERLARIEQAVDSMAIEMERVGEGQRFLTKVLADSSKPRIEG